MGEGVRRRAGPDSPARIHASWIATVRSAPVDRACSPRIVPVPVPVPLPDLVPNRARARARAPARSGSPRIVRVPVPVPLPDLVLPESCACPCVPGFLRRPPRFEDGRALDSARSARSARPRGHPTFGLNARRLALAKPDAIVMHPGPMNRGVEIAPDVADGPQSVILDQVEAGVAVRMAVLWLLAQEGPRAS